MFRIEISWAQICDSKSLLASLWNLQNTLNTAEDGFSAMTEIENKGLSAGKEIPSVFLRKDLKSSPSNFIFPNLNVELGLTPLSWSVGPEKSREWLFP
jgi:hypothetical protein